MPPQTADTRLSSEPGVVPSSKTRQAKVRHGHPPHNKSKQMQHNHMHYLSTQEQHSTMLEAYIRWLACLGGSKNPPDERTIAFRKRSDGTGGTPVKPNNKRVKTVNFIISKHHESFTNATGSENGEPGRLNRCNRAYGREDMAVRSIAEKTGRSGERPHFKAFGAGLIWKRISENTLSRSENAFRLMRFLSPEPKG